MTLLPGMEIEPSSAGKNSKTSAKMKNLSNAKMQQSNMVAILSSATKDHESTDQPNEECDNV